MPVFLMRLVTFVRPEHEIIDIQAHLRAFVDDPGAMRRWGRMAAGFCRHTIHLEYMFRRLSMR